MSTHQLTVYFRGENMNGKWTQEEFEEYHKKNPNIYRMFCRFALQIANKRKRFSAKMIFHRIRWETIVGDEYGDFKIDDGWISHYSRKFMKDYPQYDGIFETRTRKDSYFKGE